MTFWTIIYGKEEDTDYSGDDGMHMEYACVRWDGEVEDYEETMRCQYHLYHQQKQCGTWHDALLEDIGKDKYIYAIKHKWNGELLIFYRAKVYRNDKQEDRMKEAMLQNYQEE
jgi:hypothetical protein